MTTATQLRTDPQQLAALAVSLLDLTSLNDNDTEADIKALCKQAVFNGSQGTRHAVAALCIFPRFIPLARKTLDDLGFYQVKLATVANFPHGRDDIDAAVKETRACVAYGADEVDVVMPYQAFKAGNEDTAFRLIAACKAACGQHAQLKVILETGELEGNDNVRRASELAIRAGADFIKTSTGKVAVNATPEAALTMLQAIASERNAVQAEQQTGTVLRRVGFKPAGGVKTLDDVSTYFKLVEETVGAEQLTPAHFRFGASSLLSTLKQALINDTADESKPPASNPAGDY